MNCQSDLEQELEQTRKTIWLLANDCRDDNVSLLSLLRTLESLHREIREKLFEPSLPNTRHQLYNLLKEIDETGGWPYIERMKIRKILANLTAKETQKLLEKSASSEESD